MVCLSRTCHAPGNQLRTESVFSPETTPWAPAARQLHSEMRTPLGRRACSMLRTKADMKARQSWLRDFRNVSTSSCAQSSPR